METLTFHSYRGGVGKTLLSVNTAFRLAELGKKVCLVDFDLRAPSHRSFLYSSSLEITPAKKSFTAFLVGTNGPNEVISSTNKENFFCVFSDIEILEKKGSKIRSKLTQHGEGGILAKLFEFIRFCETRDFDYLVMDCMPGITYRSLDALVVSDKVMVVTRPVKSEISGLSLVTSECYSKLEGTQLFSIMNQVEDRKDLALPPNDHDVNLAKENVQNIIDCLKSSTPSIPLIHSFRRVPFVTERIYVLEEPNHSFSEDIDTFCLKLLENRVDINE
ncbi:MAG: ParA family protein [Candidatus Kariarchaeaceae archaeon]|jgi:chromosome partitioning protein